MNQYTLQQLGWNPFFEEAFQPHKSQGFEAGRIAVENRDNYLLFTEHDELSGQVTGRLLYTSDSSADLPKVGDWVVITVFPDEEKALIHQVLPRQTVFARGAAGRKTEQQVLSANIDTIFIVQSLCGDFSLNRLERYLIMVREGGAAPVVVLNKIDLIASFEPFVEQVKKVAGNITIFPICALNGTGFELFDETIHPGKTIALVGSSGVGKSTLINSLVGQEIQEVQEVRESDSRGRHTTTRRELLILPSGGLLIDTPGMREFQLWSGAGGMDDTFADIRELSQICRFNDCSHVHEVNCAVLEAVGNEEITEQHYQNYLKLQRELAHLKTKQSQQAVIEKKEKWKRIHKDWKQMKKNRRKF